jgi:hypothetical protein
MKPGSIDHDIVLPDNGAPALRFVLDEAAISAGELPIALTLVARSFS